MCECMLDERKSHLLRALVETHIDTGAPVGSADLAESKQMNVSAATVRNELAALEEEGYLFQPHTSAGRLPTEKGYRYFIEHERLDTPLATRDRQRIRRCISSRIPSVAPSLLLRRVAKGVSELAEEAVVVGFSPYDLYWTGLSYLLEQPEFQDAEELRDLSYVLDHFDERMAILYREFRDDLGILIGRDNPFSSDLATVLLRYRSRAGSGLFGILGPMRMPYGRNVALLREVSTALSHL